MKSFSRRTPQPYAGEYAVSMPQRRDIDRLKEEIDELIADV